MFSRGALNGGDFGGLALNGGNFVVEAALAARVSVPGRAGMVRRAAAPGRSVTAVPGAAALTRRAVSGAMGAMAIDARAALTRRAVSRGVSVNALVAGGALTRRACLGAVTTIVLPVTSPLHWRFMHFLPLNRSLTVIDERRIMSVPQDRPTMPVASEGRDLIVGPDREVS